MINLMVNEEHLITVGQLRDHLSGYSDDTKIFFGCEALQFYRVKARGDKLVQIEFNQTVSENDKGEITVDSHG